MHGRWTQLTVQSAALAGNPLGDPTSRNVGLYLPPGYDERAARYPSVYFLHPFLSSLGSWTNSSPFAATVPERLDALVARGVLPPFVGVFPDGMTRLGGTQWNDSPAVGRYQSYLVHEVVPAVDAAVRTLPLASSRAAVGRSSGGYGALLLARDHPEVFGHLGSNAGDAYFEYCYVPDFPKAAGAFLKAGGYESWYCEFMGRVALTKMRGEDAAVLNILAMAASYSPDGDAPMGLALPFDDLTGRIRPEVFSRWLEQDPTRFVLSHASNVRRVSSIFLECGNRDEYHLRWGTRMLATSLHELGVEVVHEEFDDGHGGTNYRFDRTLAVILPRLGPAV